MRSREEHLTWAKERANEYLSTGDVKNAIASMMSDLQKHEETKLTGYILPMLGLQAAASNDVEEARRYINGFR